VSAEGKKSDPIKLFESDAQPDLRRNKNVERNLHRQRRGLSQTVIGAAKMVLIPSAQNAERVQSAIEGGATRASMQ
jgi:hypothetical protein